MKLKLRMLIKMVWLVRNWEIYLKDLYDNNGHLVTYRLRNGLNICVRSGIDRMVFNELFLYKAYDKKGYEVREGEIVVDVGGHIGLFTLKASLDNKKGKIYVIEPNKENFSMIVRNIALNKLSNVSPYNFAIAGSSGIQILYSSNSRNRGKHSLHQFPGAEASLVKTYSLEAFMEEQGIKQIDLLKLDCEGAEYEIINNTAPSTFARIKKIILEYHNFDDKRNGEVMEHLLREKGYTCVERRITYDGSLGMIWAR